MDYEGESGQSRADAWEQGGFSLPSLEGSAPVEHRAEPGSLAEIPGNVNKPFPTFIHLLLIGSGV